MGDIERTSLPPEAVAEWRTGAEFLTEQVAEGHEPAIVRIKFDEGRTLQSLHDAAKEYKDRHPDEELVHNPDELIPLATAAFEQAASATRILRAQSQTGAHISSPRLAHQLQQDASS